MSLLVFPSQSTCKQPTHHLISHVADNFPFSIYLQATHSPLPASGLTSHVTVTFPFSIYLQATHSPLPASGLTSHVAVSFPFSIYLQANHSPLPTSGLTSHVAVSFPFSIYLQASAAAVYVCVLQFIRYTHMHTHSGSVAGVRDEFLLFFTYLLPMYLNIGEGYTFGV